MSAARIDAVSAGLPRRLSVQRDHPDFDERAQRLSDRIDVYLDGVVLPEVAGWDVDKGQITRRKYSAGKLVLDDAGAPFHEVLRGTVEVRFAKGAVE